jgi:uncharacterized protein with HEPN domain
MLRSAIERQFIIIGEAVRRLVSIEPRVGQSITGYRRIIDFRNILVHGYDVLREERVWDIVENHLAVLLDEVAALRRQGDEETRPDS